MNNWSNVVFRRCPTRLQERRRRQPWWSNSWQWVDRRSNKVALYFCNVLSTESVCLYFIQNFIFFIRSLLFESQITVFSSLPGLSSFLYQGFPFLTSFCFSGSSRPPVTANLILFNCGRTRIKIINADCNILRLSSLQSRSLNRLQISWGFHTSTLYQ